MKKRVVAVTLSVCMLFSQTAWADEISVSGEQQEVEQEDESQSEVLEEETITDEESPISEENGAADEIEDNGVQESGNVSENEENEMQVAEDEQSEEDVQTQSDEVEECNVYIGAPIIKELSHHLFNLTAVENVVAEIEDPSICTVSMDYYEEDSDYHSYFTIDGLKEGSTTVQIKSDSSVYKTYNITVKELPEDAVQFDDVALRTAATESKDVNNDGYVSNEEIQKYHFNLYINGDDGIYKNNHVKSLKGLENAKLLDEVALKNNTELSDISNIANLENITEINLSGTSVEDISCLFDMGKLKYVNLQGTPVSDADRWKLAKMSELNELEMDKGDTQEIPEIGDVFDGGLNFESSNSEVVKGQDEKTLVATGGGTAKVTVSYHDLTQEVNVKVNGTTADQPLGKESGITVQKNSLDGIVYTEGSAANACNDSIILDSNHKLWTVYPEAKCLSENVKKCLNYSNNDGNEQCIYLDTQDALWVNDKKVCENVTDVAGNFVLTSKGEIYSIESKSKIADNVTECVMGVYEDDSMGDYIKSLYILKEDKSLWKYGDNTEFEEIEKNVKQVSEWGYIKQDGVLVPFTDKYAVDEKADHFLDSTVVKGYYDTDGNLKYYDTMGSKKYINTEIQDEVTRVLSAVNTKHDYYFLTDKHDVYVDDFNKASLFLQNIEKIYEDYHAWGDAGWWFLGTDGTYYDISGNEIVPPAVFKTVEEYELKWNEDGSKSVVKNDVPILNDVVELWRGGLIDRKCKKYALRTDGTVWELGTNPVKVLDLTEDIHAVKAPAAVDSFKAAAAGKNKVKLTWNASERAEGYIIYAQKNKKYAYCGMTSKTSYVDTKALDTDYNFYWVYPYVTGTDGKRVVGKSPSYVYAKGVCVSVTNLKAANQKGSVKLTWTKSVGADGYLIYGKTSSGKYGYIGMKSKTSYVDKKASKTEWNFYWVFPYHMDANGKRAVGQKSTKYVYGKAK